jgi:hypothetical protein
MQRAITIFKVPLFMLPSAPQLEDPAQVVSSSVASPSQYADVFERGFNVLHFLRMS